MLGSLFTVIGVLMLLTVGILYLLVPRIVQRDDGTPLKLIKFRLFMGGLILGVALLMMNKLLFYAEPGYSYLVQYPWGTQRAALRPGYQARLFGNLIPFKKVLTVKFTDKKNVKEGILTANESSVPVRFNDSVTADVSVAVRYRLPVDKELFKKVAIDFRSMANLVNSALIPTAREVIRNSARMYSAQEYISGRGGEFENAILDQLENGIYRLEVNEIRDKKPQKFIKDDGREIEIKETVKYEVEVIEQNGEKLRKKHPLLEYGITVSQASVEYVDPEKKFKDMLGQQRDAAAQANVERQMAKKAEYEKQRIIAEGESKKAQKKVDLETSQIQILIGMETKRKEEQERVKMRGLELQGKKLEALSIKTIADAQAYSRRAVMQADGALKQRLETLERINKYYAEALGKHTSIVPQIVLGNGAGGKNMSSMDLVNLLTAKTAKDLSLDFKVKKKATKKAQ